MITTKTTLVKMPWRKIGDHDRDLAPGKDEEKRDPEDDDHHQGERGDMESGEVDRRREAAEVDEEPGADRREDAEVDEAGQEGQQAGEDPESAAVADLEELGHGQAARLAEPVQHPAETLIATRTTAMTISHHRRLKPAM